MTLFGNLHTDLSVALVLAMAHLALSLIYLLNLQMPEFAKSIGNVFMGIPLLGRYGFGVLKGEVLKYTPIFGEEGGVLKTADLLTSWIFKPEYYLYVSTVACAGMIAIILMSIQDDKVKN